MRGASNEADPLYPSDMPTQFPYIRKMRARHEGSALSRGNLINAERIRIRELQKRFPNDDPTRFYDEVVGNEYVFRGPMRINPLTGEEMPQEYRYPDYNLRNENLASRLDVPVNKLTSLMKLQHQGNNRKGVVGGPYLDKVLRGVGPHGNHIPGSAPTNNVGHPHFIEGRPIR